MSVGSVEAKQGRRLRCLEEDGWKKTRSLDIVSLRCVNTVPGRWSTGLLLLVSVWET